MNVFNSPDAKSYLKYRISQLPKKGRGEISKIARYLGVGPTLVSHILAGEKTFTAEQAQALTIYLGLLGIEADYFNFLIQFERSGSEDLRKFWRSKLKNLKEQSLKLSNRLSSTRKLDDEKTAIFYSSPVYMAARLYTSIGKGKNLNEIATRFHLPIMKCSQVMSFLVECGLCEEKSGLYVMGTQTIHLDKESPHLLRFQSDWRMVALSHGKNLSDTELMFTAPISLSQKDFEKLREETIAFIKNFLKTVHASEAEEVACLNLDLFWLDRV